MSKGIIGSLAVLMLLVMALPSGAVIQATSVEIRGQVVSVIGITDNTVRTWDASNFAGFWYDLKDNLSTETLQVTKVTGRNIDGSTTQDLIYMTNKTNKTLKVVENGKINATDPDIVRLDPAAPLKEGKYPVLGWQAQPYIPVKGNSKKLVKLILEQGNSSAEKKTLTVGETWDIGDGWTLSAQSIDAKASPRQAWLVLSKDGVKKDDKIIGQGQVFIFTEKSFAGESDVPLFITSVDSVFAGATSDMVQLRFTWAVGTSVTQVNSGDVFGNMEVTNAQTGSLVLKNKDKSVDLTQDSTTDIMGEMKFRVADDSVNLRYYPMVEYEIGGPGPTETGTATATGTGTVTPTGNRTEVPTATATIAAPTAGETTAAKPPAAATATPKEPAFEAVFAIAGLLAVAYLVLRQRK